MTKKNQCGAKNPATCRTHGKPPQATPAYTITANTTFEEYESQRRAQAAEPIKKVNAKGDTRYFLNGVAHRVDGPAVIKADGTKEWWQYGNYYRENNQPVVERSNGEQEWREYSELHREDGPAVININTGVKQYYQNGLLHRVGGPAIENPNRGVAHYYQNGVPHRINGPAKTYADNRQEWYQNGVLHNLTGPAVIHYDGSEEWWINGEKQPNP